MSFLRLLPVRSVDRHIEFTSVYGCIALAVCVRACVCVCVSVQVPATLRPFRASQLVVPKEGKEVPKGKKITSTNRCTTYELNYE